ncbi:hypothetical protein ACLB2K_065999 [Fragaria x ananassa]
MNEGHYIDQYNNLASYCKELSRSILGSTVLIRTLMDGIVRRFHRLYLCFATWKEGWIKGLTEVENQEAWTWFQEYLKDDLRIERDSSYTFITDMQKGLGNAIANLFANASHRHCVRHLKYNLKEKHLGEGLKQLVWNAARSSIRIWYNKHMDELRELDEEAWTWFQDKNRAQWCRASFDEECKCDILLNNLYESFNSAILPARDKLIITMLEKIRMAMMRATCYRAHRSGKFIFQVTGAGDMGSKHVVDLGLHTCTCKRWLISGIPYVHAICTIKFKKQEASLYFDDYLMPNMYKEAYTPIIYPIAREDDWDQVD